MWNPDCGCNCSNWQILQLILTLSSTFRENIKASSQLFLDNTGHSILDLLNDVLVDKADLEQLVKENDVINMSTKLPGLIVQAYLVLVELFSLDPMEPLHRVKVEQFIEDIGKVLDNFIEKNFNGHTFLRH